MTGDINIHLERGEILPDVTLEVFERPLETLGPFTVLGIHSEHLTVRWFLRDDEDALTIADRIRAEVISARREACRLENL